MAIWNRHDLPLDEDHRWRCKPGYSVFVADRGAVRFDIPKEWVVLVDASGVRIHDKQPPDDDCRLQLTVFYPPPVPGVEELPLAQMLGDALSRKGRPDPETIPAARRALLRDPLLALPPDDEDAPRMVEPIRHVLRPGLEIVWTEVHWVDPEEKREARSRHLLARSKNIMPFLTLDFWPEDAGRLNPVWKELVRSLRVGEFVADPRKGPRR